jgi:hypothetical protein
MQGDLQIETSTRSMGLLNEQSYNVEIYHRTGTLVGWVLGALGQKYYEAIEENNWQIKFDLQRIKHYLNRSGVTD